MIPEQQRIVIAETCGWIKTKPDSIEGWGSQPRDKKWHYVHQLPDYLNDLNAMHEVEKMLTKLQWEIYQSELGKTCYEENDQFGWITRDYILATASQRAEAFLKTIGKWIE